MKKKQFILNAGRMQYVRPCAWAEELGPELVLCGSLEDNATTEDYEFDDIWTVNP